ncbi:hypothetical protein ACFYXH_36725 [Streptomyces sp. NPDC002730]|uniref:hypothetical protein n=1 Tax=Streptomyces sp. NPDC002730 TaxID=3364662 RepID=UPI0036859B0A
MVNVWYGRVRKKSNQAADDSAATAPAGGEEVAAFVGVRVVGDGAGPGQRDDGVEGVTPGASQVLG